MKRIYVLDTSVVVHDPLALRAFRNTVVAIPIYVVMELDDLKTSRRPEVAAAARIASRFIHSLLEFGELNSQVGAYHPELKSHFRVISDKERDGLASLEASDRSRKMDRLILSSALSLRKEDHELEVVLVSKDVNLRILAHFGGILAEDYERDRIRSDERYTGLRVVEGEAGHRAHEAWVPNERVTPEELGCDGMLANEYVVVRDELGEHVLRFDEREHRLIPVSRDVPRGVGIEPRNAEQRIALDLLLNPDVQLITLVGRAGTGKTFLALAAALAQLGAGGMRGAGEYEKILVSKPVVALGKDIGYLPGDLDSKLEPWMTSFFDNLDVLMRSDFQLAMEKGARGRERGWEQLIATHQLEIQPLHTIRGRSISQAFMLIDEAQNLTPHELKTIITRAANGTKVVLAGDPDQVDNPFLDAQSNGLVYVTERLKGAPISGTVTFSQGQRSALAELAATML